MSQTPDITIYKFLKASGAGKLVRLDVLAAVTTTREAITSGAAAGVLLYLLPALCIAAYGFLYMVLGKPDPTAVLDFALRSAGYLMATWPYLPLLALLGGALGFARRVCIRRHLYKDISLGQNLTLRLSADFLFLLTATPLFLLYLSDRYPLLRLSFIFAGAGSLGFASLGVLSGALVCTLWEGLHNLLLSLIGRANVEKLATALFLEKIQNHPTLHLWAHTLQVSMDPGTRRLRISGKVPSNEHRRQIIRLAGSISMVSEVDADELGIL